MIDAKEIREIWKALKILSVNVLRATSEIGKLSEQVVQLHLIIEQQQIIIKKLKGRN